MAEKNDEMIPRISIPDWDDARTVATALVMYTHHVAALSMRTGELAVSVRELNISAALLDGILQQREESMFAHGHQNIAEFLEKLVNEFGDDAEN